MKTHQKILFLFILAIFVGTSVWLTFNTVSRDTFEYSEKTDIAGLGFDGWVFDGFNGNSHTKQVRIYHVTDKHGENEDTTKPIVAIDDFTFVSDEYVEYIYIGPDVRYIDEQAFVYCKQLRAIYVDDENPWYTDVDGVLYTKDMKTLLLYPICRCSHLVLTDIERYGEIRSIGADVKQTLSLSGSNANELYLDFKSKASDDVSRELFDIMLDKGAMAAYIGTYYIITEKTDSGMTVEKVWSSDESFVIPEGTLRIAKNCFYKCDRLVSIEIPSTVTEIGDMAFFKCVNIALVTLPEGLRTIGNDAFSYCENMKYSIYIPESVEAIGNYCFYQCDRLEKFYLAAKSAEHIELGGNWQPKSENSFSADEPIFSSSLSDCEEYNLTRAAEDKPEIPAAEPAEPDGEESKQAEAVSGIKAYIAKLTQGDINYFAVILLIVFIFVPSMTVVVLQVIRNMFKEDFLMSKKKKARLKRKREELERLRKEYALKAAENDEGGSE